MSTGNQQYHLRILKGWLEDHWKDSEEKYALRSMESLAKGYPGKARRVLKSLRWTGDNWNAECVRYLNEFGWITLYKNPDSESEEEYSIQEYHEWFIKMIEKFEGIVSRTEGKTPDESSPF